MITILAFGAGQDSTAILYKLALDANFYKRYVKGRLIVIMSDTGDEHNETYRHINFIRTFCSLNKIEFHFVTAEQGFHPKGWNGLLTWMNAYQSIMSISFRKSCTDNLKIKPIYNFLDNLIGKEYYSINLKPSQSRKKFIKDYSRRTGKIRVLLGIAKGEETRISKSFPHKWMNECLERRYPLIIENMDRQKCQEYIRKTGLPLPIPSNCIHCPYISEIEVVWLHRFYPELFSEWVDLEKRKIRKWEKLGLTADKNYGVKGKKLLPEILIQALTKYGHLDDEELHFQKMNRGHCVLSQY